MPIPSALVSRFFQLLVNRQFTEAQRELEKIKQKMHKTEWNRGYFRALYGMMLARRSNSNGSEALFSKMDLTDKKAIREYRRDFLNHMKNRLHGDFDRGFFSAWADCMRILDRIDIAGISNLNNGASESGKPEVSIGGKDQKSMEEFLKQQA